MADYLFENINGGASIKAPAISVEGFCKKATGSGYVDVKLSLGNPQAEAVSFIVSLQRLDFPDPVELAEVEAWALNELQNFEI